MDPITPEQLENLLPHPEATWLDWKGDFPGGLHAGKKDDAWHSARAEVMKDLVAIANGDDGHANGFLVYGVKDMGATRNVCGVSKGGWDDAMFHDWSQHLFAPPPLFHYSEAPIRRASLLVCSASPEPLSTPT
jgi:hypothetical protein